MAEKLTLYSKKFKFGMKTSVPDPIKSCDISRSTA